MSGHRRSERAEKERGVAVNLTHFPVLEAPTTISCVMKLHKSDREVLISANVQKLIVTTYVHKRWRDTDVSPLAVALQRTRYHNGRDMTGPVVRGVAEYIESQVRQHSQAPNNPESAYWNTIITEDQQWEIFVDAFDDKTRTFENYQPPPIRSLRVSLPSAYVRSVMEQMIPPLLPIYDQKFTLRFREGAYEVSLVHRSLHLGPHAQKLLMCMLIYMQSPLRDLVEPMKAIKRTTTTDLKAPVIGQFARFIMEKSRTPQTQLEDDHWKTILRNDRVWSDWAGAFDRATKRFPDEKPPLTLVQRPDAESIVESPYNNTHDPFSQTQIPTLQHHSTSQQTPGHIYTPYADPNFQPPPEQYGFDEFGNLFSHSTSMPPPQAAQAQRRPPLLPPLATGTDTMTAFESARILSAPDIDLQVANLPALDKPLYDRISAAPERDSYTILYAVRERGPQRLDDYGQKLIIHTILHLKWESTEVAEALQQLEMRKKRIWSPQLINQLIRYIYDQSQSSHKTYGEKIHWTSILSSDSAWTRYVLEYKNSKRFPSEKPMIQQKLPIPAPEPVASSSGSVARLRNPLSHLQTGPPSPPRIQKHHKIYVTVEYARALRKHYKVLPENVVESGFEKDPRNPVDEWDIPEEHIGLPMPLLDQEGFLDMEFDDPFYKSHKRARDSASLSQSPERGASASPVPRAKQREVVERRQHEPRGLSGRSSTKNETKEAKEKTPEYDKNKAERDRLARLAEDDRIVAKKVAKKSRR